MGPYPRENGVFVIRRSELDPHLREVLEHMEKAHATALKYERGVEKLHWEPLAKTDLALAETWRERRDIYLRELWGYRGAEVPRGLTYQLIRIEE
jgi:hypothetical protein